MIDLLGALASEGDARAWERLLDLAATGDERAQGDLAETGQSGLEWLEAHVVLSFSEEGRWRIFDWLPHDEESDTLPVQHRLRALCQTIQREERRKSRPEVKLNPTTFLGGVQTNTALFVDAVAFARQANPRQWRRAAERLLRERRRRPLRTLAQAFRERPFPLAAGLLFRYADHPERGAVILEILGTLHTPAVRRFALGLLRRRPLPWNALDAIEASFRSGDETLILSALRSVADKDNSTRHGPILDTIALMFKYPSRLWQPHAEWIFEHSPCSLCRGSAFRWMAQHGTIPPPFLAEAPYDVESDVREVATEFTAP